MASSSTTLRRNNRRPPRDPSAALRPKNALERQAMQSHAFRQKVQAANTVTICNTTSDKTGRLPLRSLLASDKFCVPIFQRRYCWTETQWQTLLGDAMKQPQQPKHSLGRLTCTNSNKITNASTTSSTSLAGMILEGRSCILDGQQRFTTVTILLASIRDLLEEHAQTDQQDVGSLKSIQLINDLLFTNQFQLRAWINRPDTKLEEGMELEFARLVSTYCDRWSYYAAVLPSSSKTSSVGPQLHRDEETKSSWHRPLQAKAYFMETLRESHPSPNALTRLLHAVLDGLTMLYFPVDIHQGHDDGTEDLMVIYERLALRDATFCKPTRKTEYQSMDGADMIRNLLLGSFGTQADALEFYKTYWLPLEQHAEQQLDKSIGDVILCFLREQQQQARNDNEGATNQKGIIGGQLYADFQAWFTDRRQQNQEDNTDTIKEENGKKFVEELVQSIGEDLLRFAHAFCPAG